MEGKFDGVFSDSDEIVVSTPPTPLKCALSNYPFGNLEVCTENCGYLAMDLLLDDDPFFLDMTPPSLGVCFPRLDVPVMQICKI